jgi:histidinol phosphatase-like PHP family hydrolase
MYEWLESPPDEVPEPPDLRRGFLTLSQVRATLADHPGWVEGIRGDLQMHTTHSDGKNTLREMAGAAAAQGYEYAAITDHSKGLPIARGMDEERLARLGQEIAEVNRELEAAGSQLHLLRSIEMNLSPAGEGDMEPEALATLDLVLGAFHSKLRETEDQTERYLAAVRNPHVHVLAHPRGRMYGRRVGLRAAWSRVFEEVARLGKAVEVDANPNRQDLDVELLQLAREAGCRISIGTDAHSIGELEFMEFGLAAVARAGIPKERILNFLPLDDLLAWTEGVRTVGDYSPP